MSVYTFRRLVQASPRRRIARGKSPICSATNKEPKGNFLFCLLVAATLFFPVWVAILLLVL